MNNLRNLALWIIIALLLVALFNMFQGTGTHPNTTAMSYSDFSKDVLQGEVKKVTIQGQQIKGELVGGQAFTTYAPEDPQLVPTLKQRGVEITATPPDDGMPTLMGIFINWFPMLLLIAVWVFFLRQMQAGGGKAMGFGKSRAKLLTERTGRVTFEDVAGVDEAKEELKEIVDFLKDPQKFQRLGGRIPKGVLLVGPPGTGKTLLARAVAGEADVPFFTLSGSEFVEMFVGVGAARVRDLFEQAKDKAPCIIFIDELDAIGKSRAGATGFMGGHDEREQTLNQLLAEMDGFDSSKGVIICAATNRPEVLDQALLRPGRFDRQVVVDKPDVRGREAILRLHARAVVLGPDVALGVIAARTPGFAGADLANIVNEAALLAARKEKNAVEMSDFEEAIDRVVAGLEKKSRVLSEKERDIVAHHEMGHALVASSVAHADPVHKITIIPRGIAALGMTYQLPTEDRFLLTRSEIEDRIAVLLGGRVAEELVYGEISTGAHNDLERATELSRLMCMKYGMSERLGLATFGERAPLFLRGGGGGFGGERDYSEETARIIDQEVRGILDRTQDRVRGILTAKKATLVSAAAELKRTETLEGDRLRRALAGEPMEAEG